MPGRKLRSDSVTAQVAMAQTANIQFEWPSTWDLPEDTTKAERAKLIADDIWSARPPNEWSAAERNIIAELAIVSADLAAIQKMLSDSNYLVKREGKGGRMVATRSPLLDPAQHLSTRKLALARSLGLTGSATNPRLAGARAQVFNQMMDGTDGVDDGRAHGLLA